MPARFQIVFDCRDPDSLARFWADALGYKMQPPPPGYATWEDFLQARGVPEEDWGEASAIVDPGHTLPRVYFQRVPEPKTLKNRVHLDINTGVREGESDEEHRVTVAREVQRLTDLGATMVEDHEGGHEHWVVMHDPEGNEFCVQ
ncbi:MAG TPA: VOC family protein [Chloroflexota bacterium]|nr:VOC family protein [Chloroflexota bacterium]